VPIQRMKRAKIPRRRYTRITWCQTYSSPSQSSLEGSMALVYYPQCRKEKLLTLSQFLYWVLPPFVGLL
jgi:hypothetical protein